jgi:hypothetical protein
MKKKIALFTIGVLAGIAIGVVFDVGIKAIFKQIRELHFSLHRIDEQQNQISQRLDSIQNKLQGDKKNPTLTKGDTRSLLPVVQKVNTGADIQNATNDSVAGVDSIIEAKVQADSNIVVMTNQLISVASLPLKNMDSITRDKDVVRSDSMLASMTNTSEGSEPSTYRVEFWQSPLNFKGYKMSMGKLILYGINSTSHVSLVKGDDGFYLLTNQNAYKVIYTDDYKPFERVTDKTVLKKLSL